MDLSQECYTGDPCSGKAIDESVPIDDFEYNPFIKCDRTYDDNTTCHITALKVFAINADRVLPDDLWNFVYLVNLRLSQNHLTAPLSPAVGNLTRLEYLAIGTNNFSGPLLSEMGNLEKLEELYIDGSGVSGPIPSTFSNLQNLRVGIRH